MALEPTTQAFINSLSGPPLSQLSPTEAHQVLTGLQSQPIQLQDAQIEDAVWPVGPTGKTRIRIVRPAGAGATEVLPVILYTHGGGWVLGDKITHDRLVREIANGVGATVIFVDYVNAPEANTRRNRNKPTRPCCTRSSMRTSCASTLRASRS
jgi:acetyl esterase